MRKDGDAPSAAAEGGASGRESLRLDGGTVRQRTGRVEAEPLRKAHHSYQRDIPDHGTSERWFSRVPEGAIAGMLFASVFALYMAVSRHEHVAYDAAAMAAVTHNLVNHLTLRTTGAFNDIYKLATPYAPYGIGVSIALVPFYVASKITGHVQIWESMLNPLLIAGAVVVQYGVTRTLRWSRLVSLLAALAFGSLTMALQSTTELFSEPGVGLCVLLVVFAAVRWREGWRWSPLVLGSALAVAIQFRADSALTVGVALLAVPFLVPMRAMMRTRAVVEVATPLLLSLAFLLWYNELRFGHLIVTSYHHVPFHTPLLRGLNGLLVSPGKGLFVFNLIAVPGLIGLLLMWGKDKALALLMALLIVPRVIFFAKWNAWQGGVCWGPRFLMPVVSLFVIGAFSIVSSRGNRVAVWRLGRVAVALAALPSAVVSYLSVRVPYEQWHFVFTIPSVRATVPSVARTAHATGPAAFNLEMFTWNGSIIRGNALLLRVGRAEMAPALWNQHHAIVGWLLLAGFAGAAALAIAAATAADRTSRREEAAYM